MKNIKYLAIIIFTTVLMANQLLAQTTTKETNQVKKNSISLSILGTSSIVGFTYERLLFRRLGLEAGIGLYGIGAGATVYPFKRVGENKFNFYTGVKFVRYTPLAIDAGSWDVLYMPVGVTYLFTRSFSVSADIGPAYIAKIAAGYTKETAEELKAYPKTEWGAFGSFKFSFRF